MSGKSGEFEGSAKRIANLDGISAIAPELPSLHTSTSEQIASQYNSSLETFQTSGTRIGAPRMNSEDLQLPRVSIDAHKPTVKNGWAVTASSQKDTETDRPIFRERQTQTTPSSYACNEHSLEQSQSTRPINDYKSTVLGPDVKPHFRDEQKVESSVSVPTGKGEQTGQSRASEAVSVANVPAVYAQADLGASERPAQLEAMREQRTKQVMQMNEPFQLNAALNFQPTKFERDKDVASAQYTQAKNGMVYSGNKSIEFGSNRATALRTTPDQPGNREVIGAPTRVGLEYECPAKAMTHSSRSLAEINQAAREALHCLKHVVTKADVERTLTCELNQFVAASVKPGKGDENLDGRRMFIEEPKDGRLVNKVLDSIEARMSGKGKVSISDLTNPDARRTLAELIERLQTGKYSPKEFKDLTAVLREANKIGKEGLMDLRIRLTTREPAKILEGLDTKTQIQLRKFINLLADNFQSEQHTHPDRERVREFTLPPEWRSTATERMDDFKNQLVDASGRDRYTVRKGQTLGWIALKLYNDDRIALLIAELNGYAHSDNKVLRQPKPGAKLMLPTAQEIEEFNAQRTSNIFAGIWDAAKDLFEGYRKALTTCRKCGLKHSAAESCKDTIRKAAEIDSIFAPTVLWSQNQHAINRSIN